MIPSDDLVCWCEWTQDITGLSDVKVPRCVRPKHFRKVDSIQLHYFSDASEEGYGVVSYLCMVDSQGNIACSILLGKARVPLLKTFTMSRLELTTVTVKLHKQIREELLDSTIVLQYIRNSHTRFQAFVVNRLATIHDLSSPSQWRYVGSDLNPADFASRGLRPHERAKLKIRLEGPKFLLQDENH